MIRSCLALVVSLSAVAMAAEPEFGAGAGAEASGSVAQAAGALEGEFYGLTKPIAAKVAPGKAVYVWPMPAGAGKAAIQGREFTYTMAFQHAAAGKDGAVYYVLYADSDGDGAPDTLVARSPLAQSQKADGWTSWSYTTSEHLIFAGIAFAEPAKPAYFSTDDKQKEHWNAPDRKALAAEKAGETPKPLPGFAVTNLQVKIEP